MIYTISVHTSNFSVSLWERKGEDCLKCLKQLIKGNKYKFAKMGLVPLPAIKLHLTVKFKGKRKSEHQKEF